MLCSTKGCRLLRSFCGASNQLRGELVIAGQQEAEVAVASLRCSGHKSFLADFELLENRSVMMTISTTSTLSQRLARSHVHAHAPSSASCLRSEWCTAGISNGPNLGKTRCRHDAGEATVPFWGNVERRGIALFLPFGSVLLARRIPGIDVGCRKLS